MAKTHHTPLFSDINGLKVNSTVSELFSGDAGPAKLPAVARPKHVKEPKEKKENKQKSDELPQESGEDSSKAKKRKRSKKTDDDDADEELEGRYFAKTLAQEDENEANEAVAKSDSSDEEEDSKSELDDKKSEALIHESLLPNQSEVDKAKQTVFVGNVPRSVITDKTIYKKFEELFSKYGKIKSTRFRSIAFSELLPRKAAFAQKKFHESRDAANAYIVYDKESSVREAVSNINGAVFEENHLRVDSVAHPLPQDNKRCIFVGNMDFEESEESLWRHFNECGDIENVRIVRDAKTNMGKGFGYIQFKDTLSVTKALLLDKKKMASLNKKGTERALRVSRSKNIRKPSPADRGNKRQRLTGDVKSQIGRAKAVLNKAGRSQLAEATEGHRAKPGEVIKGLTGKRREKNKKRITKRSTAFKKENKTKS